MRVVVKFSRNPSDEWESLKGLAETSRNIIELARVYQWGRSHHHPEMAAAAKKRAVQLGFRVSELEADQRGILRNPTPEAMRDALSSGFDKQGRQLSESTRIRYFVALSKQRSMPRAYRNESYRGMTIEGIPGRWGVSENGQLWPRSFTSVVKAKSGIDLALELRAENPSGTVNVVTAFQPNLTDRAQRYRANAEPPAGPKRCFMCGTRAIDASGKSRLMVGHLDGHESHNEPENLVWTCRSCNTLHANALKRARMGRRTAQFNPTKSGGAYNVGEWANAVGAIRAKNYPENRGREGALGAASTMSVSDAVAMIRATPQHKRQQFAAALGKHRAGRRGASEIPF